LKNSLQRVLVSLVCGLVFFPGAAVVISAQEAQDAQEEQEAPAVPQAQTSVRVQIDTEFLEDESLLQGVYVWRYNVALTNRTNSELVLTGRRWLFFDERARLHVAEDDWLEGDEPRIPPARTFRYTTLAELETPTGSMTGSFFLTTVDGQQLEVAIETVELAVPVESDLHGAAPF